MDESDEKPILFITPAGELIFKVCTVLAMGELKVEGVAEHPFVTEPFFFHEGNF